MLLLRSFPGCSPHHRTAGFLQTHSNRTNSEYASVVRILFLVLASWICSTATVVTAAGSDGLQVSISDVLERGRPANLFKVTYQRDEGICRSIARELNKGHETGSNHGDYFGILTATDFNITWSLVPRSASVSALYVEQARADVFNDGEPHVVFRVHGSLGGREFDSLYADRGSGQNDISSALKRVAPQGEFEDQFAVPPGDLLDYYAVAHAGLPEDRGLRRYDIIALHNATYVVEGSFYVFAPFDAILVYRGHSDHTFSIECSLDPQTTIPPQPLQ